MGVDEIYRGKKGKFLSVVCNLETAEPLWFGRERKKETLDDFFRSQLVSRQRKRIEAACVDMWEPFRLSMEEGFQGAASSMTSSTSSSTPTTRWTKCGGQSSSAKGGRCAM
jgi:transposase